MSWYKKAAGKGNASAMYQMAALYEGKHNYSDRESPFKNYKKAMFWYRKAADSGEAFYFTEVGLIYTRNKLVPKDYNESFK